MKEFKIWKMVVHLVKKETKEKWGLENDQHTRKDKEKIADDAKVLMFLSNSDFEIMSLTFFSVYLDSVFSPIK